MEESLTDRGDGEELIITNVEGVHSTDKDLQPSQLCVICGLQPAHYVVKF